MKGLLRIPRPSKKLFLVVGGLAFLCGLAGAVAVYIGKDRLLGETAAAPSVLACTDVNLVKVTKRNRNWIRKYIRTAATDGMTRVRTGLREAQSIARREKADLVQVIVLDEKGPSLRSEIGSRAEGAEIIYVPDPTRLPPEVKAPVYSARYYDGSAGEDGLFFGERIDLPQEQVESLAAALAHSEAQDCIDPTIVAATEGGEGKTEKGAKGKKVKGEHGAATAQEGEGGAEAGGEKAEGAKAEAEGAKTEGEAPAEAPAETEKAPAGGH